MGVVGFQDFMVVGGRVHFKRDIDSAGVQYPWVDLGVLDQVTPSVAPEQIELKDTDGGIKRLVDQTLIGITETYEVRCKNLSLRNLSYALLANPPEDFTQSQTEKVQAIRAFPGALLRTHDSDSAKTSLFNLDAFGGIYTGTVSTKVLTTIVKATKTLTVTGDQTAVTALAPGKAFIVMKAGLTNIKNSGTYTIVTRTLNGGNTDFVVAEEPAANESAITGQITHENAGVVYKISVDFEVVSLSRGIIRIKAGGAISTEQDVTCVFTIAAITGKRKISPQSLKGAFKGTIEIWLGRGNNAEQTVREAKVSLVPSSVELSVEDYSSIGFTITVLGDITKTDVAGRMVHILGTVPDVS